MPRNEIPAHLKFNQKHFETIERAQKLITQNVIPDLKTLDDYVCQSEQKTGTCRHYNAHIDPLADARILHAQLLSLLFGFWTARTEELEYPRVIRLLWPSETIVDIEKDLTATEWFYKDLEHYLDQQTAFSLASKMMDDLRAVIFLATEITVWQSTSKDESEYVLKIEEIGAQLFLTKEALVAV